MTDIGTSRYSISSRLQSTLPRGIICLFVFPLIGIFVTGFAIIMSIREGRKLRQEMRDAAYEIKAVRDSMPEK
jgi:hypothetical protein